MYKQQRIILASSSPRRRELLTDANVAFDILVPGCDEIPLGEESAKQMVERLALLKAQTIASDQREAVVIGADTTVVIEGKILGKPENKEEAVEMLSQIQGREHNVWGAFAVVSHLQSQVFSQSTRVTMMPMTKAQIDWYVATKEPLDKAGSYAIQGIGLQFVESIVGSYSNVVGLNIGALMNVLRKLEVV